MKEIKHNENIVNRVAELRARYARYMDSSVTAVENIWMMPSGEQLIAMQKVKDFLHDAGSGSLTEEMFATVLTTAADEANIKKNSLLCTLTTQLRRTYDQWRHPLSLEHPAKWYNDGNLVNWDTSFFTCSCQQAPPMSFRKVLEHICFFHGDYCWTTYGVSISGATQTAICIFHVLGVPLGQPFQPSGGVAICACAKPSLQQPATFTNMVCFT